MTKSPFCNIPEELRQYIETEIIPLYDHFDAAHQRDHAQTVIRESEKLISHYDVNPAMVYTIAAFHDVGLCKGRELHHEVSAQIIRNNKILRKWFTEEEIYVMANAAEDHRASTKHAPRTIYGRIVAEADRLIDTETVLRRTVQFGLSHYPELSKEEHYKRMCLHLKEKYDEGGYLQLWIPESPNAKRLTQLREVIHQPQCLRAFFERFYKEEKNQQTRQ